MAIELSEALPEARKGVVSLQDDGLDSLDEAKNPSIQIYYAA